MRFTGGIVVGLILSLVVSAGAQTFNYFLAGTELQNSARNRQMGYVAGVYDTLGQVLKMDDGADDPGKTLSEIYACLDRRGDDLETLTDWGQRQYAFHAEGHPAAHYLLIHACDKP